MGRDRCETPGLGAGVWFLLGLIYTLPWTSTALGQSEQERWVKVGRVQVQGDSLLVDVVVGRVLTPDFFAALTRGATSALSFEIRLWRVRKLLPDALVLRRVERAKIIFEPLEVAYAVSMPDTASPTYVDLEELEDYLCRSHRLLVTSHVSGLPAGTYYLTVTVVVEPLALESYQELQRWLRGEAGQAVRELGRKQESGHKSRTLRILLDLTGFGDRAYATRSPTFALP
ncbi:MAG: DUF4390 domain-containing protein [candidate division KSB1 bacterium]|nr:DUF4390 domain-containing protein [candidate division KSB1 bacterium]